MGDRRKNGYAVAEICPRAYLNSTDKCSASQRNAGPKPPVGQSAPTHLQPAGVWGCRARREPLGACKLASSLGSTGMPNAEAFRRGGNRMAQTSHEPRLAIPVSNRDHAPGPPEAPLSLIEYGDFECPFCGMAYPD